MLYLDNAATTHISKEVVEEMLANLEAYGNTEAKFYKTAEYAKEKVEEARQKIARLVNAKSSEVVLTSGATEANNLVLQGVYNKNKSKKNKIIISAIEHSSVYDTCQYLKNKGAQIEIVPVDQKGLIDINFLDKNIDDTVALVSLIYVNNEIGTIQDLIRIDKICKNKKVYLHIDATQAVGKVDIDINKYQSLKFITFTSHKIYGPKGIGCLIVKEDENGLKPEIEPMLYGGEQEYGLRAGTTSNLLAIGFGKACEIAKSKINDNQKRILIIESSIKEKLKNKFQDRLVINNNFDERVHDILNIRIKGYNNMMLLKTISPIIAASTGSACSVSKPSRVLKNIGLSEKEISESIRLSFSCYMDPNDLDELDKL